MSISSQYPNLRPSLLLDFANTGRLDSRISFTRASSATFFDQLGVLQTAASGAARFTYDPATLQPQGLLIEEQRTNLCLQSAAISTSPWQANGLETCVASAVVDPAGGTNSFLITVEAAGFSRWRQPITLLANTTYTMSAWVRAVSGTVQFRLRPDAGGATSSDFTASTTWQRFTHTFTTTSTNGNFGFCNSSDATIKSFLVWGAQLEAGAFPTSYIPTTTTALTRNADVASMTGTNFSSWYNASEGTVVSESLTTRQVSAIAGITNFDDGTAAETMRFFMGITAFARFVVVDNSVEQANLTPGSAISANAVLKMASAYKLNDFATVSNGSAAVTDSSATVPTVSQLKIGYDLPTTSYLNGTIRRLAFYPQRLSNAQLVALTG